MKLKTIALASAFAMSSTFALAQAGGGAPGAAPESSRPAVNGGSTTAAPGTTTGGERMQRTTPGETTGTAAKPGGMDDRNRAVNQPRANPQAKSNPSSDFDLSRRISSTMSRFA
jgi:hypothetical protein